MKTYEVPSFLFNYAFEQVAAVFYDRYPNSFAKHIVSEDVLSREITKDRIITKKLIVKQGASFLKSVPRWLTKSVSIQYMPTLEESVYDRNTKKLMTLTRNISWCKALHMRETCLYKPYEGNRTEVKRNLSVSVSYGHISALAERFLIMGFRKSTKKTTEGYLEKLTERFGQSTSGPLAAQSSNSVISISENIRNKKKLLEKV